MEKPSGLSEVARFLSGRVPFDSLSPEELSELVRETEVEFHAAGTAILTEDGGPVTFLRVIHSGAVDIVHAGELLDLLGPGDTFGQAAMMSGLPPGFEARAAEDTLCYRIPVAAARPLVERARRRELQVSHFDPGRQAVAKLIRSRTVRCRPDETVREVAAEMTTAGATAAIIDLPGGEFGILTDRDVRSRVVGRGLPFTAPVSMVMTTPVFSVTPERLGQEVLFELLERGIRHAPVVDDHGHLIGVVEDADLFPFQPHSWFAVRRAIARASSDRELTAAAQRLPRLFVELHASDMRAREVARVVSALADAITVRALELTSRAWPAPGKGLVWVAVGSQARREMTPGSVAQGAIVCREPPDERWMSTLADKLRRTGMGSEVRARTSGQWSTEGPRDELGLAVLVERRALWGTPVEPLPRPDGPDAPEVIAALRERALAHTPPTGFDAEFVLGAEGARSPRLDIRRAAVIPIVELGRWAAAVTGCVDGSTPERLAAAGGAGALAQPDARNLADAFEVTLELRIAHHAEQLAAGGAPDDEVDPATLSPLARDHLRDVFRVVTAVQRTLR